MGIIKADAIRVAAKLVAREHVTLSNSEWVEFYRCCYNALFDKTMGELKSEAYATLADSSWQDRMKKEYRELKERYEKLHRMVTKYEAGTLDFTPNCSLELLSQQKKHMGEYLHDLEIRAEIEGVEL